VLAYLGAVVNGLGKEQNEYQRLFCSVQYGTRGRQKSFFLL
jgi:hypothetical protein